MILAVPSNALDDVLHELGGGLKGKVVVDVTNRFTPNDVGATLDGHSNTEKIKARASGAHVVKAFNAMFAARMAEPEIDGMPSDVFVAGDDQEAKQKVIRLADSMGMRGIDAGPLAMARALEGMGILNIQLQIQNGWPWQSAIKLIGPTGGTK